MAWFGKKGARGSAQPGDVEDIVMLSSLRLGAHGIRAEVLEGTSGADTVLVDAEGRQFALHNLIASALPLSPDNDEYHELIMGFVDSMVEAVTAPSLEELSDEEWMTRVRIRLAPESARVDIPASYAQPVAPGLVTVLCIDSPTSLAYVGDAQLQGRDLRALFDAGYRSVMEEPVEVNEDAAPGIRALAGSSLYTATKMIGIRQLLGTVLPEAPDGVVVGVPHRHLLFVHPLSGTESVSTIGQLASMVAAQASDDAPGGPLSASVYFWKDDVWEVVGGRGDDGAIQIHPSERMIEALGIG